MSISTIIVPLDGSDFAASALAAALPLARRIGADVLVGVSRLGSQAATDDDLEAIGELLRDDPDVGLAVVADREPVDLIRHAAELGPDRLVVMATHGRHGLRKAVLGSVADAVLRTTSAPVLLVGPKCAPNWIEGIGPIELCIDGSVRSDDVVAAGIDWAKLLGRDTAMVHVLHPLDVEGIGAAAGLLARVGQPLAAAGLHHRGHTLLNYRPAPALIDSAENWHSPLMVMAPHGRTGWAELLIGSTTLECLAHAPCPVLVTA